MDLSNSGTTPALLHELAEHLQALGNYLRAARFTDGPARNQISRERVALDRAMRELACANDSFHRLRGSLRAADTQGANTMARRSVKFRRAETSGAPS